MDSAKDQLADKLKTANNVLVTVSRDPSVDQLAALLGLTLLLNKLNKHAAAVYSGQTPSTIEFLKPEETFEKNTDSLRDFIIALDKSKADKLRYKVEDNVVRIFITPYKTSISDADLEFSQGDFNVDVVVAIGVAQQEDLDEAITSHGRILHDATVASINTRPDGGLGTINWHDSHASSLSELVTDLIQALNPEMLDNQIATALLTGIVAETERFSNDKTSAQTMQASAALMAAGADQQLVATKLAEPAPEPPSNDDNNNDDHHDEPEAGGEDDHGPDEEPPKPNDGSLEIEHEPGEEPPAEEHHDEPEQVDEPETPPEESHQEDAPAEPAPENEAEPQPAPDQPPAEPEAAAESLPIVPGPKLVTEPPTLGGTLTANAVPEGLEPTTDPLSVTTKDQDQLLSREDTSPAVDQPPADQPAQMAPPPPAWMPPVGPAPQPAPVLPVEQPAPPADQPLAADQSALPPPAPNETLAGIEAAVEGAEAKPAEEPQPETTPNEDSVRDEISRAYAGADAPPEANQDLNAMPLSGDLHKEDDQSPKEGSFDIEAASEPTPPPADAPKPDEPEEPKAPVELPQLDPTKPNLGLPDPDSSPQQPEATVTDNNPPPDVPPPIPSEYFNPANPPTNA